MSDLISVTGAAETAARLRELGQVKIPNTLRRGVYKGAVVLRTAIRAEAPVAQSDHVGRYPHQAGNLRRRVRITTARGQRGDIAYLIGPMGKEAYYARWVVRGHDIRRVRGGPVLGHVGGNPFVDRGAAAATGPALDAIAAAFREAIT